MAFRIHYSPLCVVSIRHGFHLNKGFEEFDDLAEEEKQRKLSSFDIFDDLRLEVPDDTTRMLAGLGLLLKPTPTGFIVGSAVEESAPGVFVPRRIPGRAYRLRFALRARAPFFWDYTNLHLGPSDRAIYYLSNRAGELDGSFPFLSVPPQVYAAGTVYRAGDVVRASDESVERFLAIRTGAHETPTNDDPNWLKIGRRNYVNTADRAALHSPIFTFRFPPDTVTMAFVDLVALDETVYQVGSTAAPAGETLEEFRIDARAVPPGQYLLQVNGLDISGNGFNHFENVYIDAELSAIGAFAIIELFHEPGETLGDFRLYDETADFRLREPEFMVHLLNRHTFWRYHFPDPPDHGTDLGDLEQVGDQFVTKRVMPLTRGVERVKFGGETLLPNPPGGPIVPEADRVYSDIYVHTN